MACKSLCYPCPYDHRFVSKMIGVLCNKILPQGQQAPSIGITYSQTEMVCEKLAWAGVGTNGN